eukprot:13633327-Ditylum_brightwellii.AAC.1
MYVALLEIQFESNNIYEKVQKLVDELSNDMVPILLAIERYESIGALITELMLSTEKKCQRANTGYA